jgi:rhodanese-related sulfurtransferase
MPTRIDNEQLRSLLERDDVQLVDVLPPQEHEEEHLPGAIGLPLKKLDASTASVLDRSRPVVVYCWDYI